MARPENPKTPLAQRLVDIRKTLGYESRKDFSDLLDVKVDTLGSYERGVNEPNIAILTKYRENWGVSLSWLLTGDGDMFSESASVTQSGDMVEIPLYDVQAAAGPGLIPTEDDTPRTVAFSRAFLRSIGARPEKCIMLEARGESMLPTIPDGTFMIVDQSKTRIVDDEVFVFRVGPGLKVKRANWRMDGALQLKSDNEAAGYSPEEIEDADDLAVVGQVLSLLRKA
ncbi:MAG: LexA family transcriptional regulator [Agrobacterium cavarae]